MFEGYKKDRLYPIPEGTLDDNAWIYDGITSCINVYTDGSFKKGQAG